MNEQPQSALHAAIMNLPVSAKVRAGLDGAPKGFYLLGHRDARHAAAELVAAHQAQSASPVLLAAAGGGVAPSDAVSANDAIAVCLMRFAGFDKSRARRVATLILADDVPVSASAAPGGQAGNAAESDKPAGFVKPDTDRQVFFYEQDFYVLSNFSAFTLVWNGIRFDTSEAAYHCEKFPEQREIQYGIRIAPSAHEAYKVAERYKHLRRLDWDEIKVGVMREILRAKAHQHEYVRRKLLATGNRELIEDSWRDDYWGWGPNRDGQNMLGRLWMEIRSELRAAASGSA